MEVHIGADRSLLLLHSTTNSYVHAFVERCVYVSKCFLAGSGTMLPQAAKCCHAGIGKLMTPWAKLIIQSCKHTAKNNYKMFHMYKQMPEAAKAH